MDLDQLTHAQITRPQITQRASLGLWDMLCAWATSWQILLPLEKEAFPDDCSSNRL